MRTHWGILTTTFALVSLMASSLACADIGWSADEEHSDSRNQQRLARPARNPNQPDIRQLSEAFGHFIGQDLSKQGLHLDVDAVIQGIRDGVAGKPPPMDQGEYEAVVENLRDHRFQELANFNLALADAFMASNGKRSDVIQAVPGRVQFVVLQKGRGGQVEAHTSPLLKFTGRFVDGTIFTATENDQALPVPLDDMIPGFREGVIGMREGEVRRIFIHPDAAYGVTGEGAPNSLLLFDVEVAKLGNRPPPPAYHKTPMTQGSYSRQNPSPKPQDDWDLSLDDNQGSQGEEEQFSSRRLVLKPVSYDTQQKPRQQRNPAQNTRSSGNK